MIPRALISIRTLSFVALTIVACQSTSDGRHDSTRSATSKTLASLTPSDTAAAKAFLRDFYEEYAPRGSRSGLAATDSLLVERPALFAPPLLAALRQDAAARAVAVGEIDGLDFEPFLASQDPCPRYAVGHAQREGASQPEGVRVTVTSTCDRARGPDPRFVVEVVPQTGTWQIVNLYYEAPGDDLIALLWRLHPPGG